MSAPQPIVLAALHPGHLGSYLAIYLTPSGVRAWRWGWAGAPRSWEPFGDAQLQLSISGYGNKTGAVETTHDSKRVTLAGRVMHRYDVRDLFKRLGDPMANELEYIDDTPPAIAQAEAEAAALRREEEDRVADRDEVNDHRAGWRE